MLWTPAFFIAPNYFGAPSSPVSKTVQAGIYRFGVEANPGPPLWHMNAVVEVPDANSIHLPF